MKVAELYQKYQIMPQLETHMLRVSAIGKRVAQNWKSECDTDIVTKTCLLHDMGNIVKFDLSNNADRSKFGPVANLKYWQSVKQDYIEKYGTNAHDATTHILHDAGLEEYIKYINEEEQLYFAEAGEKELLKASLPAVILLYADCRVVPSGIVSYRERINDLVERYGGVRSSSWLAWTFWFDKWMQEQVKIDLNTLTEESLRPIFDDLLTDVI